MKTTSKILGIVSFVFITIFSISGFLCGAADVGSNTRWLFPASILFFFIGIAILSLTILNKKETVKKKSLIFSIVIVILGIILMSIGGNINTFSTIFAGPYGGFFAILSGIFGAISSRSLAE